jgi:hypothetical protein
MPREKRHLLRKPSLASLQKYTLPMKTHSTLAEFAKSAGLNLAPIVASSPALQKVYALCRSSLIQGSRPAVAARDAEEIKLIARAELESLSGTEALGLVGPGPAFGSSSASPETAALVLPLVIGILLIFVINAGLGVAKEEGVEPSGVLVVLLFAALYCFWDVLSTIDSYIERLIPPKKE